MKLHLDFYGITVQVRSEGTSYERAFSELRADFEFFVREESVPPASIRINLVRRSRVSHIQLRAPFVFRTKECAVHGWGKTRVCVYGNDLTVIQRCNSAARRSVRVFWLIDDGSRFLHEAAYVAILSAVGEELDALGFHRLHGLAFVKSGKTGLIPLPSHGGKSSIAALMLRERDYQLHSDEIPLIKDGCIHPFPIRVALFPEVARKLGMDSQAGRRFERRIYPEKVLFPIPAERVAKPSRPDILFLSGPRPVALRFIWSFVLGLGTPQMAQYMLRMDNLPKLAWIALSRLRTAVALLARRVRQEFLSPTGSATEDKTKLDLYFKT